ncbi:MAG TPA: SBBP repeat-containing protein [Candidatus Acidoferrales bacterium]|nr:SBBP repeat-containing protein [Candidatus Acidoferrales bacterium]
MRVVGTRPSAQLAGIEELPSKSNYFLGDAPQHWRTNVPNYAKVKYESVYRGVDLLYYGSHKRLEYDFVVAPGSLPSVINLEFTGAERITLDSDGDLLLRVAGSDIRMKKPLIYQTVNGLRRTIPGGYVLGAHHQVGFQVTSFDSRRPLVIDPVLVYSTYLEGTNFDFADGIAVDSAGDAYVVGETSSTDFPTTNSIQAAFAGGGDDVFVAKLNPTGNALIYSTYLGGGNSDFAGGIAVDSAGNAYVAGTTASLNFPTHNPIQAAGGGTCGTAPNTFACGDAFIAKLDSTGSTLVYSTYLGGGGDDQGAGVALDSGGNAYVVGSTSSLNFPTANALQSVPGAGTCGSAPNTFPCYDAFVTKLNAAGSALVYSTYLGGNGDETGSAIAVDSTGSAYVTGTTFSPNFPTSHPLQAVFAGGDGDAFVAKLSAAGSSLVYSTYLGGTADDSGRGIAVDSSGNAYVTGGTDSHDFMTVNPYQAAFGGGPSDVFFAKLNSSGSAALYSTYLGGAQNDAGVAIALDSSGDAYLTGNMDSGAFVMVNPFQKACGGCQRAGPDGFVAEIDPTKVGAASLIFSSFIGGTGHDAGAGIAVDASGNVYVAGQANATFPVTPGAFQTAQPPNSGAFVMKISPNSNPGLTVTAAALAFGNVNVGVVSGSQSFILGNAGSATLNIGSIGISGTNSSEFTQTNNCGISLAGGTNCTVTANFSPTSLGAKVAAVSISTNAAGSPHSIGLSGTAVGAIDFTISASPALVTLSAGQTASYTITVSPTNGFTGTVSLACNGAPTLANCSLPASVTITGTNSVNANASVTTAAHSLVLPPSGPEERNWRLHQFRLWLQLFVVVMLAAILRQLATKSRSLPRSYAYLGAALLVVVFWASGCGGGSGGGGGGGGGGGTPSGNYTLTFAGTSGALRHTTSVSLNVN